MAYARTTSRNSNPLEAVNTITNISNKNCFMVVIAQNGHRSSFPRDTGGQTVGPNDIRWRAKPNGANRDLGNPTVSFLCVKNGETKIIILRLLLFWGECRHNYTSASLRAVDSSARKRLNSTSNSSVSACCLSAFGSAAMSLSFFRMRFFTLRRNSLKRGCA